MFSELFENKTQIRTFCAPLSQGEKPSHKEVEQGAQGNRWGAVELGCRQFVSEGHTSTHYSGLGHGESESSPRAKMILLLPSG